MSSNDDDIQHQQHQHQHNPLLVVENSLPNNNKIYNNNNNNPHPPHDMRDDPTPPSTPSEPLVLESLLLIARQLRAVANCTRAVETSTTATTEVPDRLWHLLQHVTALESTMEELQEILQEEQQALEDLAEMEAVARDRNVILRAMLHQCGLPHPTPNQPPPAGSATSTSPATISSTSTATTTNTTNRDAPGSIPPVAVAAAASSSITNTVRKTPAKPILTQPSKRPSPPPPATLIVHFEPVTSTEWERIPRTQRGRITTNILNDAMQDLEQLMTEAIAAGRINSLDWLYSQQHEDIDLHHRKHHVLPSSSSLSKYNHLYHNNNNNSNITSSSTPSSSSSQHHPWRTWVTEQEIRHFCTFFRHGEATARCTLLLLRTLHRLQLVPGKQGEFLYFVP